MVVSVYSTKDLPVYLGTCRLTCLTSFFYSRCLFILQYPTFSFLSPAPRLQEPPPLLLFVVISPTFIFRWQPYVITATSHTIPQDPHSSAWLYACLWQNAYLCPPRTAPVAGRWGRVKPNNCSESQARSCQLSHTSPSCLLRGCPPGSSNKIPGIPRVSAHSTG